MCYKNRNCRIFGFSHSRANSKRWGKKKIQWVRKRGNDTQNNDEGGELEYSQVRVKKHKKQQGLRNNQLVQPEGASQKWVYGGTSNNAVRSKRWRVGQSRIIMSDGGQGGYQQTKGPRQYRILALGGGGRQIGCRFNGTCFGLEVGEKGGWGTACKRPAGMSGYIGGRQAWKKESVRSADPKKSK